MKTALDECKTAPGECESDICDNPCTRCGGDGMIWAGKRLVYCGRCGSTGKEPAHDPDAPQLFPKCRQPRLT